MQDTACGSMFTLGSAAFSAAAAAMRLLTASLSNPPVSAPASSSESSCAKADGFLAGRAGLGLAPGFRISRPYLTPFWPLSMLAQEEGKANTNKAH